MYVSKKYLSRRAVLRGAGVALGLPFLNAMVPAATALAQTAAAPRPRLGYFYLPHGAIMGNTTLGPDVNGWTPAATGADFDFKDILKPLEPLRSRLTVVSQLHNRPGESSSVHAIMPGTWLSCVAPAKSQQPRGGVTVDQLAARHIGQDTPLPSIEIATEIEGGGGQCDGTYGCSFGKTISFANPTTPLPMEADPRKVFEKLFGRGKTDEERGAISRDLASLLDMVTEDAATLKLQLGAEDRVVMDDYLENVREIERRMQMMEQKQASSEMALPEIPVAIPDFGSQLNLMFDLIALAYQANLTRVSTYMLAAEVSSRTFPELDIPEAFHPLSHRTGDPQAAAKLMRLQAYFTQAYANFAQKLADMPDGENSILDNSILVYGSNMSSSNRHDNYPLPMTVLGGGAGTLKGNQHLRLADHTPLANLHLTVLQRAGVPETSFGDSTGTIEEL
jgi:hypothetical protein